MKQSITECAGVDTGKRVLDVAVAGSGAELQVGNDEDGHQALVAWLERLGVRRVGIEASGGYERPVARALRAAGVEVIVFQPVQVRAYATFRLQRAKNDKIDARMIAIRTAACETVRPAPDPRIAGFAEHLTWIEQIEEDSARFKTRRDGFTDPNLKQAVKEEVNRLRRLSKLEARKLVERIAAYPDLARRLALPRSIPGVGLRTALALLIRMPELGRLSREEAAALAGLAPFDDDSGQRNGKRRIAGGRHRLRRSLYAAALPAAFQWNPAIIALYKRLTDNGKPHKLALVACARKLLIYANTVLERQTPWENKKIAV